MEQYSQLYIQPGEDCAAVLQALCAWKNGLWSSIPKCVEARRRLWKTQKNAEEGVHACAPAHARMCAHAWARTCTCAHVHERILIPSCVHARRGLWSSTLSCIYSQEKTVQQYSKLCAPGNGLWSSIPKCVEARRGLWKTPKNAEEGVHACAPAHARMCAHACACMPTNQAVLQVDLKP